MPFDINSNLYILQIQSKDSFLSMRSLTFFFTSKGFMESYHKSNKYQMICGRFEF